MYQIEFIKSALKDLQDIDKKDRAKILKEIELLAQNPFSELLKYKKLKASENLFRIRIGDYRVIYNIEHEKLVVLIIRIGHRREVYRGLH